MTTADAERTTTDNPVAHLDELDVGSMKLVRVEGRRLCLVRTSDGVHALDNACPHEGYGLVQGELDDDLLTCEWHNWKFRVSDGACVLGEEAVRAHRVDVAADGAIRVELNRPDPAELRPQLRQSLASAIERDYRGQVARDVVRLLQASDHPGELIWQAVAYGAPRAEFGWGHSIASATDCLAMVDLYDGDQRALPIVQGIAGIAETERGRPVNELPEPADSADANLEAFRRAVEAQQLQDAQAVLLAAIERGDDAATLMPWFTGVVADHHLSYGHGAIYSQKAFELLDMIGWDRAATVLPHLVSTIVYGTREDRLPYMRPFMGTVGATDLAAVAGGLTDGSTGWNDDGALAAVLLGGDRHAAANAVFAALAIGASLDDVLDVVVDVVSERMLRYDTSAEFDFHDDFGWLDITHGLTYAHAARWHLAQARSRGSIDADVVRLVLFTAFQAQWTGRHEWHTSVGAPEAIEAPTTDLVAYGESLQRDSLLDGTTAFIVHAHAVKTSRAAALEALTVDSARPLDATARFLTAPKLERFVAATVARSIDFLNGRAVRDQ
ncbi:MAG: Rieske 2Fe-2S domain-containing protein [Actinomycetota bacterium]